MLNTFPKHSINGIFTPKKLGNNEGLQCRMQKRHLTKLILFTGYYLQPQKRYDDIMALDFLGGLAILGEWVYWDLLWLGVPSFLDIAPRTRLLLLPGPCLLDGLGFWSRYTVIPLGFSDDRVNTYNLYLSHWVATKLLQVYRLLVLFFLLHLDC